MPGPRLVDGARHESPPEILASNCPVDVFLEPSKNWRELLRQKYGRSRHQRNHGFEHEDSRSHAVVESASRTHQPFTPIRCEFTIHFVRVQPIDLKLFFSVADDASALNTKIGPSLSDLIFTISLRRKIVFVISLITTILIVVGKPIYDESWLCRFSQVLDCHGSLPNSMREYSVIFLNTNELE